MLIQSFAEVSSMIEHCKMIRIEFLSIFRLYTVVYRYNITVQHDECMFNGRSLTQEQLCTYGLMVFYHIF